MSAIDRLAEDAAARQRALELASFIVEAPAGAGKTELLTQRYLRLLAVVDEPEEVLALTFTNKAATEMRDRILGSLEMAAGGVMPSAAHKRQTFALATEVLVRDARRDWRLLAHPGRLRITTLDALCASLARQMPLLSRFGAQPGVSDDAATHYAAAARRTLEMLEEGGEAGAVLAEALAFMDNDAGRLERLLVAMLGRRDQWVQHTGRIASADLRAEVEAGFAALVERELSLVAALLDAAWQARLLPLARYAAANVPELLVALLDRISPLQPEIADLPAWQDLAKLLLTATGTLRKSLTKNVGFPAGKDGAAQKAAMGELLDALAALPGIEAALGGLADLPQPQLSDEEWATVECFSRLLRLAAGQLWLVFQEAGEVDFIEIAARAGLALGDDEAPTDLAQALDYRIQHLLVDEFQDTSPGQVSLLARLTRGWTPGDGRTLFVVGDPMQSIYRFRKADVGLFLRVRERGIGDLHLEHLRLFRNNRSDPAVVDWVNHSFPTIFPAADAPETGAVRFVAASATRAAEATAGIVVHPLLAGDDSDAATAEAGRVLEIIRSARRNDPQGRIAVLVRARSHLDALVAEIRRHAPDLPFQAVDIEGLVDRQHIQDLLILYRALLHRADRVHWLALLRAPWCGLTLADLHALVADERRLTVWQLMQQDERLARLSQDGRRRLQGLRRSLRIAFSGRGRQSERRWLEGVWLMLGGPRCLPAVEAMADVEAFFALMDRLAASRRLDPESLAAQAAELYAPVDPLGGAVQMMTIHKAKGLEFETVILPGLHRDTGGNESSLLLWDEVAGADGREHLLVAPMRRRGARGGATAHDCLRRLEMQRTAHESERLLYVAATRAIRDLHLLGVARIDETKEDGLRPPRAGSLLSLLWPGVARPQFLAALARGEGLPAMSSAIDPAGFEPPLLRLREPGLPDVLAAAAPGLAGTDNAPGDLPAVGAVFEAAIGTLVHRCLELVVRHGLAAWPVAGLVARRSGWERWLQAQGLAPEAARQGADEVGQALRATLESASGRWLLAEHPQGAAEQAWSTRSADGGVEQHVIDRVFVSDGCRWIVDYKTVRLTPAEQAGDVGLALRLRAEGFRAQLERYAGLFRDDPLPLRLAVFFTLQGQLVELS